MEADEAASPTDGEGLQWLLGRDAKLLDRAADQFEFPSDALRVLGASRSLGTLVAHYEASVWRSVGLSAAQGWLVTKLLLAGPTGQSEIAEDLQVTRSSVSQLADRLEAIGLIARQPSAEDRRVSLLNLTDEGRARVFAVLPTIRDALEGISGRIGAGDLEDLLKGLERLSQAISDASQAALPEDG